MTILITGSRGKTALPLIERLCRDHRVLVASRTPSTNGSDPAVRFDWHDRTSWELPFTHPGVSDSPIDRVYLVGPDEVDTASDHVIGFMEYAKTKGVKRMVLLSAWEVEPGGVLMGRAHAALAKMGEDGMEYAVLRPNFFMDESLVFIGVYLFAGDDSHPCECWLSPSTENFIEGYHQASIKTEDKLYSAADSGRLAFVSAQDIAAVAFRALTDEQPHNKVHFITGPRALSYDEVASSLSDVLGRTIEHLRLTAGELEEMLQRQGLSLQMAKYMTTLDQRISQGSGSEVSEVVKSVSVKGPSAFRDFANERRAAWA